MKIANTSVTLLGTGPENALPLKGIYGVWIWKAALRNMPMVYGAMLEQDGWEAGCGMELQGELIWEVILSGTGA